MKPIFSILFCLLVISINSSEAQFAIGGGIAFTTNTNDVGIQLKSQFTVGERWRVEASLDGYSTGNESDYYGDFNINANYIFTNTESVKLHALLGGAIFFGSISTIGYVPSSSTLAVGVNVGTGMQYRISDNLAGYLDGIFTFTDYGQADVANRFLFTLGVIYEFNNQAD